MIHTVVFNPGQTSVTVPVLTVDDSFAELIETFGATLSLPNGNGLTLIIGNRNSTVISIVDNDRKSITCVLVSTQSESTLRSEETC